MKYTKHLFTALLAAGAIATAAFAADAKDANQAKDKDCANCTAACCKDHKAEATKATAQQQTKSAPTDEQNKLAKK